MEPYPQNGETKTNLYDSSQEAPSEASTETTLSYSTNSVYSEQLSTSEDEICSDLHSQPDCDCDLEESVSGELCVRSGLNRNGTPAPWIRPVEPLLQTLQSSRGQNYSHSAEPRTNHWDFIRSCWNTTRRNSDGLRSGLNSDDCHGDSKDQVEDLHLR